MKSTQFTLLEYDRSKTAQAFGQKLLAVALKDRWLINELIGLYPQGTTMNDVAKSQPDQLVDQILQYIEKGDPTKHKEYAQSIAKMYSNGLSKMEDIASTLADYLSKFDRLKRKKKIQPPRNDFNRYRSLEDFYDVVDEYPDEEAEKAPEVKQNAQELYRDSNLIVLVPKDVEAACYYGQGTRWCTAAKNNNMYDYYTKGERPLYIIIPRKPEHPGEKYQFHFETKQFMNEQDRQIGAEGMTKLVARFPVLTKILQKQAEHYTIAPLLSDEYKNIVKEFTPEAMKRTNQMVMEYKDRIIAFGFKSMNEYGIRLDENQQQTIASAMQPYIDQVLGAMRSTFWPELAKSAGAERSEERVETMLSADNTILELARASEPAKLLAAALQQTGAKLHKDAIPHILDLLLRDPLFRFVMRQVPKMYTAKLQENGHALQ